MSNLLKDKIALVTGASRGIGQGIALALAQKGAIVIGTATTENGAAQISVALREYQGRGMTLNVDTKENIDATIAEIKKEYGAVSILVNNAAITKDNLFLRMKEEEWDSVINTDLSAIFRLSKACLRDMLKARFGRIINIGSVVGNIGNPGQANYCAAKAGVLGLTKSLALEVGSRDITVNTIAPGYIATDMTQALTDEQRDSIFARIPMQKIGTVEDIAAAVIFLAGPGGNYITGQTLHINGGMYMP